ncbi:MAG TPA: hypothetical protein VGB69_03895 [Edaphobacter sp.]
MHRVFIPLLLLALNTVAEAQGTFLRNFASDWSARATKTQAEQPKWAVPMFSPFPMLAQVYRADFIRQKTATGASNWNMGGGKGFNLIPFARTQVDIFVPGYMQRGDGERDGIGDMTLLGKYRFLSRPEKKGNYVVSAALSWNIPTGSHKNGMPSSVLTPTLLAGKGFGRLDLMTSLGGGLPTSGTATSGRTIHWNSVAQYRVGKFYYPQLEINSTSYLGGTRDGKTQVFLAPGLMVGRIPIRPTETQSRLGITLGVGFQTAATSFHTYNHAFAASARLVF